MKDSMRELRISLITVEQHESAAHPQMSQQRPLVVELEEYELAPTVHRTYSRVL
jgi:hypothetical protein